MSNINTTVKPLSEIIRSGKWSKEDFERIGQQLDLEPLNENFGNTLTFYREAQLHFAGQGKNNSLLTSAVAILCGFATQYPSNPHVRALINRTQMDYAKMMEECLKESEAQGIKVLMSGAWPLKKETAEVCH